MSKAVSLLPVETNTALFLLLISNRMFPELNTKVVYITLVKYSTGCFGGANQIHEQALGSYSDFSYSNLTEKNKHTCPCKITMLVITHSLWNIQESMMQN